VLVGSGRVRSWPRKIAFLILSVLVSCGTSYTSSNSCISCVMAIRSSFVVMGMGSGIVAGSRKITLVMVTNSLIMTGFVVLVVLMSCNAYCTRT